MKSRFLMRTLSSLAAILLVIFQGYRVRAEDWITKGGSPSRPGVASQPMGMLGPAKEWWRLEQVAINGEVFGPGQSATQPIVVGEFIYHLAGNYLWRVRIDSPEDSPMWAVVNRQAVSVDLRKDSATKGQVMISSSTPTYSPESGMIYFGTAYGWLWGFDTKSEEFRSIDLDGCPIVTSPLVIRKDGRDLVIVGDKDATSGNCFPGPGGNVWLVWGLDDHSGQVHKQSYQMGGWVTPSAVPVGQDDKFIAGTDGVACYENGVRAGDGKVLSLQVKAAAGNDYFLQKVSWMDSPCTAAGQAGSFASAGDTVYWTDVNGHLYARRLADGSKPTGWPDRLHLPTLIGGGGSLGFTNTEPAIDTAGGALYVTLRNFVAPGDTTADGRRLWLRGCGSNTPVPKCQETGAPGAVVAIDLASAEKRWAARLPAGTNDQSHPSINTSPLVLRTRRAVLFGDVNGTVHGYDLKTGATRHFAGDEQCRPMSTIHLLAAGEEPVRGKETWSQVSGVGTDPMLTPQVGSQNPLLLMGVNIKPPPGTAESEYWRYGRLVAIRAGDPYNLAWAGGAIRPEGPVTAGQPITITGEVHLTLTDQTLGQFRSLPVPVRWFVSENRQAAGRAIQESQTLPADLRSAAPAQVTSTITLLPEDPDEGFLVGVIDPEALAHYGGPGDTLIHGLMELLGIAQAPCPGLLTTEVVETPFGASQGLAFSDNWLFLPYQKHAPANLRITIGAPNNVAWSAGGTYTATFTITNEGATRATFPFTATARTGSGMEWSLGGAALTLAPGETATRTRSVSLVTCGESITVTGVGNPEPRAVTETTYADNLATAVTEVGACRAPGPSGGGADSVLIVPADCIANPDPASRQPCLNYPHLIIP